MFFFWPSFLIETAEEWRGKGVERERTTLSKGPQVGVEPMAAVEDWGTCSKH